MLDARVGTALAVIPTGSIPVLESNANSDWTIVVYRYITAAPLTSANLFKVGTTTPSLLITERWNTGQLEVTVKGTTADAVMVPTNADLADAVGKHLLLVISYSGSAQQATAYIVWQGRAITQDTDTLSTTMATAAGNIELGDGVAGSRGPSSLFVRNHSVTVSAIITLWAQGEDLARPFSDAVISTTGTLTGRDGLVFAAGHAFFTDADNADAAIIGSAATVNNTPIFIKDYQSDPYNRNYRKTGILSSIAGYQHDSPFNLAEDWGGHFKRNVIDRGNAQSVARVSPLLRQMHLGQTPTGQKRVAICQNSLSSWGTDAGQLLLAGNWPTGLIEATAATVIGTDMVPLTTGTSHNWFAFEGGGNQAPMSGSISSGNQNGAGFESFCISGGSGSGTGLLMATGASFTIRFKPEGSDDIFAGASATLLDRSAATQRLWCLRGPWAAQGSQCDLAITPHRAPAFTGANGPEESPSTISLISSTVISQAFSTPTHSYNPTTATFVLAGAAGSQWNPVRKGWALYTKYGAAATDRAIGIIESITQADSNVTIVLQLALKNTNNDDILESEINGQTLRVGPLEVVKFDHNHPAVTSPNLWRGFGFTATCTNDAFCPVYLTGAWRTSGSGWVIMAYAKGNHQYRQQLTGSLAIQPFRDLQDRIISMVAADLDLVILFSGAENESGDPNDIEDALYQYTGLFTTELRAAKPGVEIVWTDVPHGEFADNVFQNAAEWSSNFAGHFAVACLILSDSQKRGPWEDTAANGEYYDGRHLSWTGYANLSRILLDADHAGTYALAQGGNPRLAAPPQTVAQGMSSSDEAFGGALIRRHSRGSR